jgi:hypothetical protein
MNTNGTGARLHRDDDRAEDRRAGRFTAVFLLEIDELTMLAGLDARRDYHDWGHVGDTREYLRRKLPALQGRLRASGAIPIDARQPPDRVADAILAAITTGRSEK